VPLVYDGKVYFGSFDTHFYCLDAKSGKEIWRFKTGGEIYSINPPLINKNVIYFTSFDNNLYALNTLTGKELWRFRTGKYGCDASPVIHENILYQPSRDGILYAISLEGKELWRFQTHDVMGLSVFIDNKIYVGSCDNNLYVLDLCGKELWRFQASGYVVKRPAVWGKRIYLCSWDCHVYCIDIEKRKELWRFTTSTTEKAYIPPPYEAWELQVKEVKSEADFEEERYKINTNVNFSDIYEAKSEYQVKVEYQQKMKY